MKTTSRRLESLNRYRLRPGLRERMAPVGKALADLATHTSAASVALATLAIAAVGLAATVIYMHSELAEARLALEVARVSSDARARGYELELRDVREQLPANLWGCKGTVRECSERLRAASLVLGDTADEMRRAALNGVRP